MLVMPRTLRMLFWWIVFTLLLGLSLFWARPLSAQTPPNLPCRGCHGDNDRSLALPSGEALPLAVDLVALDASAHSYLSATAVTCSDCHVGERGYRYPHPPPSVETRRAYAEAAAQTCEECHYPHNPLHEEAPTEPAQLLPTCIDCHGSHTVASLREIPVRMPTNCVACHTDQPETWAADFLQPRAGHGEGAVGYAGSDRCFSCHADLYLTWRTTLHAKVVQDATANPAVILGDFGQTDPDLTFAADQVAYVIGSRWRQQYITRTVDGAFTLLPGQWNVATAEWVAATEHPDNAAGMEWRQACSGCHVTGVEPTRGEFTEFGVGCEDCHGPAAAHIADPENVDLYVEADDQVCGACHSRGTAPDGLAFPATYRPGEPLADHFTLTTEQTALWPDGSAKQNHQQYMDWQLDSKMAHSDQVRCSTCHAVHEPGVAQGQLRQPLNDLCLQCHNEREQQRIVHHIPYHEQAIAKHEFTCTDCHMPLMATTAAGFDLHNHSFLQPNPQLSLDHGGVDKMPNACNQCHTDYGEDPAWAVQTIAYAGEVFSPNASAFFGAGPTPTSPPPPTPLPSVGQPVERMQVETGRWVRITAFVILGLIGLGMLAIIINWLRARRRHNA